MLRPPPPPDPRRGPPPGPAWAGLPRWISTAPRPAGRLALTLALALGGLTAARGDAVTDILAAEETAGLQTAANVAWVRANKNPIVAPFSISTTWQKPDGTWVGTGQWGGFDNWGRGFFPGILWHLYGWTGVDSWRTDAIDWTVRLESAKNNTSDHDLGDILYSSFGEGYHRTGVDAYREVCLTAANTLSVNHWIASAGVLWSFDFNSSYKNEFPPGSGFYRTGGFKAKQNTIIDSAVNMELLFFAARNGGAAELQQRATTHLRRLAQEHLRPDGSNIQVIGYWVVDTTDTNGVFHPAGSLRDAHGWQGFSKYTTWSRGQGWAIHGFTTGYRESGDPALLEAARRASDYYLDRVPADQVPYWDFDADDPAKIPPEYFATVGDAPWDARDSSAAALAASGLLELYRVEPDPVRAARYFQGGEAILQTLVSPAYQGAANGMQSLLAQGCYTYSGHHQGIIWGDFYYVQALDRYHQLVAPDTVFAAGHPAGDLAGYQALTPRRWRVQAESGDRRLQLVPTAYAEDPAGLPGEYALRAAPAWNDSRLRLRFRLYENLALQPAADIVAVFDYRGPGEFEFVRLSAAPDASGHFRVRDGAVEPRHLLAAPAVTNANLYHDLALDQVGERLTVSLDGAPLFELADPVLLGGGQVGFGSTRSAVFFDDPALDDAAPTDFAEWVASLPSLPAEARDPADDPDGDGLSNRAEFWFDRNPLAADPALGAFSWEGPPEARRLRLAVPVNPRATGVLFLPEWSQNLRTWQTVVDGVDGATVRTLGHLLEVSRPVPASAPGFLRVRAVGP